MPVTVLRAAVVVGHGSISWEITRQLVDHLPALVTPRWVNTRVQPIALADVVRYLVGVLEPESARGQVYEIGGPDVLRYIDMLERAAAVRGKGLPNVTVPLLTPRLSSVWLALVTDVDLGTARNLVDSMTTEVIVHDRSIEDVVPGATLGYEESVRWRWPTVRAAHVNGIRPHPPMTWRTRVQDIVAPSLIDRVPRDHEETDRQFRASPVVVAIALVAGAVLLGFSLWPSGPATRRSTR